MTTTNNDDLLEAFLEPFSEHVQKQLQTHLGDAELDKPDDVLNSWHRGATCAYMDIVVQMGEIAKAIAAEDGEEIKIDRRGEAALGGLQTMIAMLTPDGAAL